VEEAGNCRKADYVIIMMMITKKSNKGVDNQSRQPVLHIYSDLMFM
jgi:hypothetical protein